MGKVKGLSSASSYIKAQRFTALLVLRNTTRTHWDQPWLESQHASFRYCRRQYLEFHDRIAKPGRLRSYQAPPSQLHQVCNPSEMENNMKNLNYKQISMAVTGLLVTWQATNFSLNYRAVLSAVIASGLAGANTQKKA